MGDMAVHERLQFFRKASELSVAHCARAMGWTSAKIWERLEAGERRVTFDEVKSIAAIVGVTVSCLMGEQPIIVPGYRRRGPKSKTHAGGMERGLGE